jgi:hypothetical protein
MPQPATDHPIFTVPHRSGRITALVIVNSGRNNAVTRAHGTADSVPAFGKSPATCGFMEIRSGTGARDLL